jgi:RNA polymerase sigma-70 factor (ECF subfamily)
VLQEIFVSIWRAAQGYDAARAQPMTWLTSIARNRAIDSLRRGKTEVATVSALGGDDDDDGPNLVDTLPSDLDGPVEMLAQAAQARAVSHCIGALSAEQQQCVALAYYQGLSHSEVAAHLKQPLGTVKSWVRRALMALKDCLGQAVPD